MQVGPELEVPGYGCEDHFAEMDTIEHSWEALSELLRGDATAGIVCDVGMPVIHRGVRYNCRVFLLNGRILLIRPKMVMADDGNYRSVPWRLCLQSFRLQQCCLHHVCPQVLSHCYREDLPLNLVY